MKFTKEEAFEKLKSELTKGGKTLRLTERTINEMLDTLIPLVGNDELELDDFSNNVFTAFNTANGNMEKDYSDFVKNYKPAQTRKSEIDNDVISTMKAKLDEFEAAFEQKKKDEAIAKITKTLRSTLKEKGVKDEEWLDNFIPEINITEDFDIESKVTSFVKLYNKSKSDAPAGITPLTPANNKNDLSKLWDDLKEPKKD